MKGLIDVFRKRPDEKRPRRQVFETDIQAGMTLLDVFHKIREDLDPTFAYRYSCRGAICGSCAVRINGQAALACKTQAAPLAEKGAIVVDPLGNMPTVRDLAADFAVFWEAYDKVRPYLSRTTEKHDPLFTWEDKMGAPRLDQLSRCADCIKCAACFSDCPKRASDARFIGPQACAQMYKFFFDPRDGAKSDRADISRARGGVVDCDNHAVCVKVCPKDVRPLRAITFIKKELSAQKG